MAIVKQAATPVAGANSYVDAADADTYFENRLSVGWDDLEDEAKEEAILVGARYLDGSYDWIGTPVSDEEGLYWPVYDAVGIVSGRDYSNMIPVVLQEAQLELASAFVQDRLAVTLDRETILEKVGPLEVEYAEGSDRPEQPLVDLLLKDLAESKTGGPGGARRLTRY